MPTRLDINFNVMNPILDQICLDDLRVVEKKILYNRRLFNMIIQRIRDFGIWDELHKEMIENAYET